MKISVLYSDNNNSSVSYNDDWLDAISNSDANVVCYNLRELELLTFYEILRKSDYLIFLHSTNSNGFTFKFFLRKFCNVFLLFRKAKIVFFVGNEHKLMPEKLKFIKNNKIEFVVSQFTEHQANWLYFETGAKIISLPHALNLKKYHPKNNLLSRTIDIGNRFYLYPDYIGDNFRDLSIQFVEKLKNRFNIDISSNPSDRFSGPKWAEFLNKCKYTVSTEAGCSFLERDDKTRKLINYYSLSGQKDKISMYFKNYKKLNNLNGKLISGRHFDAIGTKTCQILFEGNYSNILKRNIHYIELKNDLSNAEEVIETMSLDKKRLSIVEEAYEYIVKNHLYEFRIEKLLNEIS